jgi:hypothetical protein
MTPPGAGPEHQLGRSRNAENLRAEGILSPARSKKPIRQVSRPLAKAGKRIFCISIGSGAVPKYLREWNLIASASRKRYKPSFADALPPKPGRM